jgi:hypothetical protein
MKNPEESFLTIIAKSSDYFISIGQKTDDGVLLIEFHTLVDTVIL